MKRHIGIACLAAAFAVVFINCGEEETPSHNNPDTGGYDTGEVYEDSAEETSPEDTGNTPDDDSGAEDTEVTDGDSGAKDTEVTDSDSGADTEEVSEDTVDETTSDPCADCRWIEDVPLWSCAEYRGTFYVTPREDGCWLTVHDSSSNENFDVPPSGWTHNEEGHELTYDNFGSPLRCVPTSDT